MRIYTLGKPISSWVFVCLVWATLVGYIHKKKHSLTKQGYVDVPDVYTEDEEDHLMHPNLHSIAKCLPSSPPFLFHSNCHPQGLGFPSYFDLQKLNHPQVTSKISSLETSMRQCPAWGCCWESSCRKILSFCTRSRLYLGTVRHSASSGSWHSDTTCCCCCCC